MGPKKKKNPPSIGLAVSQKGRTLVFSLESTFKWPFLCIYNLFNLGAAQTLDCTATEPQTEREAEDLEPFQKAEDEILHTRPSNIRHESKWTNTKMHNVEMPNDRIKTLSQRYDFAAETGKQTPKVLGTTPPPE